MNRFTLIEGFSSIEDCCSTINNIFPNIGVEQFDVFDVQGMYYAVTMHNYEIEIVVSKEYIRCRMPGSKGLFKTSEIATQSWEYPGIHGGSRKWNERINIDARTVLGEEIVVRRGKETGGPNRKSWANNTKVLLNCLFADKTRDDDNATY